MLVVIGNDLINPQQITHITEERLSYEAAGKRESAGAKIINIHMSSGKCLSFTAGGDGYAAACALRDKMLKAFVNSLAPE